MKHLINLDALPQDVAQKIAPYMEKMLGIHGEIINSIFIYGSACGTDYIKGSSDINSAIIFSSLSLKDLQRSLHIVDKGIRQRISAPLFLTKDHIMTSCDTFPVEFSEMREGHIIIYGENIFQGMVIEPKYTRFICEQQLKGKLIRIRQAYLEIGLRRKGMEALIKESFSSLFPIFRGLLRLKGITPPAGKLESLKCLSKNFEINVDSFEAILADNKNDEKMGGQRIEAFLEKYIQALEHLATIVDKL